MIAPTRPSGLGGAVAVRLIEADLQRSADTHLLRFPLAPWAMRRLPGRERYRPVPQGREHARHRVAEAPAGPIAVPVFAVQRLADRRDHRHRVVQRVDRGLRGLFRPDDRPAVRGGDAGPHVRGEDRADRDPGRALPSGRRSGRDLRRIPAAGRRVRRALHGPIHPCRTGNRLARQQQHRRIDLRPAAPGASSGAGMDRHRGRDRRHQRDDRPVRPVPGAHDPDCACPTRRAPRSSRPGATGTPRGRNCLARSRASAGRGSSRHSSGRRSTGWCRCPTRPQLATMRELEEILGRRVGPSTGTNLWAASVWSTRCAGPGQRVRSSHCSATPATGTPGPTTTTTGLPSRVGTCGSVPRGRARFLGDGTWVDRDRPAAATVGPDDDRQRIGRPHSPAAASYWPTSSSWSAASRRPPTSPQSGAAPN